LTTPYILALVTSKTNLFAATYDGVFRSTDNGLSWFEFNEGLMDSA